MDVSQSCAQETANSPQTEQNQRCEALKTAESHGQLCSAAGQCVETSELSQSRKRVREAEEEAGRREVVEKRGCEEGGMSWWTCLMLGVSQDNSKQQVVRKVYHQKEQ